MKKMTVLLTNYKVSKQLTCLDITALGQGKIKLEMALKRDDCVFSEHSAWWKQEKKNQKNKLYWPGMFTHTRNVL